MGFEDKRPLTLNLRENPKNSWWVSENMKQEGVFCEECGKGFKSLKAVFGHMRLHPKRKVGIKKEAVKMPNVTQKTRLERRYTCSSNSSLSDFNTTDCSSVTVTGYKVDNEELQDIAACLLMLSKGGFYSNDDIITSDDDSVKLGFSFPNESAQKTTNFDVDEGFANAKSRMNSCGLGCGCVSFKEEVAEFHGFDCKNVDEVGPNNGEYEAELYNVDVIDETIQVAYQVDSAFNRPSSSCYDTVPLKQHKNHICSICNRSFPSGQARGGHRLHCPTSERYRPSEPTAVVETNIETDNVHSQKADFGHKLGGNNRNKIWKKQYQCLVCLKEFPSGQALGGHKRAHFNGNFGPKEQENLALKLRE